ncbi:unnamed protein product [Lampetra planeri]
MRMGSRRDSDGLFFPSVIVTALIAALHFDFVRHSLAAPAAAASSSSSSSSALSSSSSSSAASSSSLPAAHRSPRHVHAAGPVRLRHLYSPESRGSGGQHLHLRDDGTVDGAAQQSKQSLLEMRWVDRGVVAIKGVSSQRYLCMDDHGGLHGSTEYRARECAFRERTLPDGYTVFYSAHRHAVVTLSPGQGRLRSSSSSSSPGRHHHLLPPLSQFLATVNAVPLHHVLAYADLAEPPGDDGGGGSEGQLDVDDPLGMDAAWRAEPLGLLR